MKIADQLKGPLIIWFLTILAIRCIDQVRFIPFIEQNYSLVTAILLLYIPIIILLKKKEKISFLEMGGVPFIKNVGLGLAFTVVILGFGCLIIWMAPWFSFYGRPWRQLLELFFTQIVVVALPEEFFFRGYLQERLNRVWSPRWRLLGVQVGPGYLWACILFAFSHSIITLQLWHPLIFFPALGFGWLKEKTGTITASVIFHACCNLFSYSLLFH